MFHKTNTLGITKHWGKAKTAPASECVTWQVNCISKIAALDYPINRIELQNSIYCIKHPPVKSQMIEVPSHLLKGTQKIQIFQMKVYAW